MPQRSEPFYPLRHPGGFSGTFSRACRVAIENASKEESELTGYADTREGHKACDDVRCTCRCHKDPTK